MWRGLSVVRPWIAAEMRPDAENGDGARKRRPGNRRNPRRPRCVFPVRMGDQLLIPPACRSELPFVCFATTTRRFNRLVVVSSRPAIAATCEERCQGDHRMKTLTMKWIQFAVLLSALALPAAALTGCNTSKGFGKDVESVGD